MRKNEKMIDYNAHWTYDFSHKAYLYLCVSSDMVDLSFTSSTLTMLMKSTKFIWRERREATNLFATKLIMFQPLLPLSGVRDAYQNREYCRYSYEEKQERFHVGRPAIRILVYDSCDYPGENKYSWQTWKTTLWRLYVQRQFYQSDALRLLITGSFKQKWIIW